jgi:hypothetical protein
LRRARSAATTASPASRSGSDANPHTPSTRTRTPRPRLPSTRSSGARPDTAYSRSSCVSLSRTSA